MLNVEVRIPPRHLFISHKIDKIFCWMLDIGVNLSTNAIDTEPDEFPYLVFSRLPVHARNNPQYVTCLLTNGWDVDYMALGTRGALCIQISFPVRFKMILKDANTATLFRLPAANNAVSNTVIFKYNFYGPDVFVKTIPNSSAEQDGLSSTFSLYGGAAHIRSHRDLVFCLLEDLPGTHTVTVVKTQYTMVDSQLPTYTHVDENTGKQVEEAPPRSWNFTNLRHGPPNWANNRGRNADYMYFE